MAKRTGKSKGRPIITHAGGVRSGLWTRRDLWLALSLVAAVFLVFLPALRAGFIWDDDEIITSNPCVVGPYGLKEIWTTPAADICPLTLTSFWAEHALWGSAPLPFHLVNLVFHAACALVLWRLLRFFQVPGAWLGAALWALHPVQAESVAWVSEMKNTQSGFFFLLALLFFFRHVQTSRGSAYALSFLFAAFAMAGKSSTVILSPILLLGLWWMQGRLNLRACLKTAPFFLLSILAGLVSIWTQSSPSDTNPRWALTWPQRFVAAGDAVWFYLGKLLWPHPLIAIYPRWPLLDLTWLSWIPLLAVLLVSAALWLGRLRPLFFTWSYFLLALFPVLGFLNMGYHKHSLVADHFQYLAAMGPLALVGAGLSRLSPSITPGKPTATWLAGAVLLLAFATITFQRTAVYQSDEKLWTDTLNQNPGSWAAHNNLGHLEVDRGHLDAAWMHAQKSLAINPDSSDAHNLLGIALIKKGDVDGGLAEFKKVISLGPLYAEGYANLGAAYARKGDLPQAIANYRKSLQLNPAYIAAYDNLGAALVAENKIDEAIGVYRQGLDLDPGNAEAHNNLGDAFLHQGRIDMAIAEFQKAIELKPAYADPHDNLGFIFLHTSRLPEAAVQFQKAIELDPNNANAHNNLGIVLAQGRQLADAISQFREALRLRPDFPNAQQNLARAQAEAASAPPPK